MHSYMHIPFLRTPTVPAGCWPCAVQRLHCAQILCPKVTQICTMQAMDRVWEAASPPTCVRMTGEFQVTVCGVTVCPFWKTEGKSEAQNAFKTRLKCTCHEIALSVTRQTCTWNCVRMSFPAFKTSPPLRHLTCTLSSVSEPIRHSMSGLPTSWLDCKRR